MKKSNKVFLFIPFVLLLTLFVSFLCIWLFRNQYNFDTRSYEIIGNLTLKGKNIYPDPAISRHPYLPLFLYFEAGALVISSLFRTSQVVVLKVFLLIFHIFSVFCVYQLTKHHRLKTILYAINPISLGVTFFHGQFDIIPLSLLLIALVTLSKKKLVLTVFLLSLAITIKSWPLLFIIPFLRRIPKKYWVLLLPLPIFSLLFYSLFFHTSPFSILRVLMVYQGVNGIWGLGKILSIVFGNSKIAFFIYKLIFVIGFLFASLKLRRKRIVDELLYLFLLFFVFTPGFGIQWLLWPIPFLFLLPDEYLVLTYCAFLIPLFIGYLSWITTINIPIYITEYIFFLFWVLLSSLSVLFISLKIYTFSHTKK